MNYFVLLRMVPDTVEELTVAEDGKSLDSQYIRFKISDTDDHALEQALLLKEKHGGEVTVVALDAPEVDEILFAALARGANRAVKLLVESSGIGTAAAANIFTSYFKSGSAPLTPDTLILPGSQAIDDLEGELAAYLADALDLPCVSVVGGVTLEDDGKKAVVIKEFSGGLRGEFELPLPAVLGIQAAEKPPRYVPVAKVRAAMKSSKIETVNALAPDKPVSLAMGKMYKPEVTGRAQMLEGTPEEVAEKLADVLAERGII